MVLLARRSLHSSLSVCVSFLVLVLVFRVWKTHEHVSRCAELARVFKRTTAGARPHRERLSIDTHATQRDTRDRWMSASTARANVASTSWRGGGVGRRDRDAQSRARERRRQRRVPREKCKCGVAKDTAYDASVVQAAKQRAEETTKKYAKSFYLASLLMTSGRDVAYALYAWCRELDELVDGSSSASVDETERALDGVLDRLRQIFKRQIPKESTYVDLAMFDAVPQLNGLGVEPFADMVEGMRMDARRKQFETFADVELYAYRVAGTVALMILPILTVGLVEDAAEDTKRLREERGVALGMALQMTNIARDVGEDRRRDPARVYLAAEDLRLFGLTRADIVAMKEPTFAYKAVVELQIQRALAYYRVARSGLRLLPSLSRPATNCISGLYKKILLSIRDNDYDNLNKRAFATNLSKIFALPSLIWNAFSETDFRADDDECDLHLRFDDVSDRERQAALCELVVAIRGADDKAIVSITQRLQGLQHKKKTSAMEASMLPTLEDDLTLWYTVGQSIASYVDETIKIIPDLERGSCAIYRRSTQHI